MKPRHQERGFALVTVALLMAVATVSALVLLDVIETDRDIEAHERRARDARIAADFKRAMNEKVDNGHDRLVLDLAEVNFIDDKDGKPIGINQYIGKRPIVSFGNSGGDREMLEWTGAGDGKRLMMLVFHDDAEREYAYGPADGLPDTHFGAFPQSLMDEANARDNWHVISMKDDWATIFPR